MGRFRNLATGDGAFEKLREFLDSCDASFAAGNADRLGIVHSWAHDDATALKWLEYGITRDPNDAGLKIGAG